MQLINVNTKIGNILKQHPEALEAIIEISPKFEKLRNPILRKVIAGRTSIAMAAKLGGCSVDDFFDKLQLLGFEIDKNTKLVQDEENHENVVPEFIKKIAPNKIETIDVRPIIESGKDPLNIILQSVKTIKTGNILKIINSFAPTPLVQILNKQGFESYIETVNSDWVNTYFYKKINQSLNFDDSKSDAKESWDEVWNRFEGKLETIDVRALAMPLPMHTIIESLQNLPINKALLVYHKRIPVFLLPELEQLHFSYRIKEITDAEVHLLIFKD